MTKVLIVIRRKKLKINSQLIKPIKRINKVKFLFLNLKKESNLLIKPNINMNIKQ